MAAVLRAEAGRNPYGRGLRRELAFRAPMVQGPQGLACDAEYRVEAGQDGQT